MRFQVRGKIVSLMLVVGLVLAACGTGGDGEDGSGGHLTVAAEESPTTLDPITGSNGGDHVSLYPMYDRLVNFNPETLEPVPGLATSWESPDPKTLVLTLREGVKFHDGTDFNAEAVKFNLERALDKDISTVISDLTSIDSVEATEPNLVTINLNKPDASIILTLADRAGMMVSPAGVEEHGDDFGLNPVGTGPYVFSDFAPNESLELVRNEEYWQDAQPSVDQITMRYFGDQQTANNAMQSGQVDIILNVELAAISTLEGMSGVSVLSGPSILTEGCYLNHASGPLSTVEGRRALAFGIDREALNESFAFGAAEPTSQLFPRGYWATDESLIDTFTYDPDKSRQYLRDGGFGESTPLTAIVVGGTSQVRKSELIQQQLKPAGFEMEFDVLDPSAAGQAFYVDQAYDMVCTPWTGRPDPSQTANSLFAADAFYNLGGYVAPGMPEALAEAASAQTQEARAQAFSEVIAINQEYVVWLPLLSAPSVTAVADAVDGLETNLLGKLDVSFVSLDR